MSSKLRLLFFWAILFLFLGVNAQAGLVKRQDNKIEKVSGAVSGNLPVFDSGGGLVDGGVAPGSLGGGGSGSDYRARMSLLMNQQHLSGIGSIWDGGLGAGLKASYNGFNDYYSHTNGVDLNNSSGVIFDFLRSIGQIQNWVGGIVRPSFNDNAWFATDGFTFVAPSPNVVDLSTIPYAPNGNGNHTSDSALYKFGPGSWKITGNQGMTFGLTFGPNFNVQNVGIQNKLQRMPHGTADWTYEGWINFTTLPTSGNESILWSQHAITNTNYQLYMGIKNNSGTYQLHVLHRWNGSTVFDYTRDIGSTPSTGVWYHFAFVRASQVFKMFWGGVQQGTDISDSTDIRDPWVVVNGTAPFVNSFVRCGFGSPTNSGLTSNGTFNLDDLVGSTVAVYTNNFTPSASTLITPTKNNMVFLSAAISVADQPNTFRIGFIRRTFDALTLNTDIQLYASRGGGTTWTQGTLVSLTFDHNFDMLYASVDLSGQPAGTSLKYKVQTFNNKDVYLYGAMANWD